MENTLNPDGKAEGSGSEKVADQAVKLLNDWQDISLIKVLMIVVGTWLASRCRREQTVLAARVGTAAA